MKNCKKRNFDIDEVVVNDYTFYKNRMSFNFDHYIKVLRARENTSLSQRSDYKVSWDTRSGYDITGNKLTPKYHYLHDYKLYDTRNKRYLVIDSVTRMHHEGAYLEILYREESSGSHGCISWKNISCHNDIILKFIEENNKNYKLIKK